MPDTVDSASEARVRSEGPNARVTVSISLKPRFGKELLKVKYGVARYDLAADYAMAESLKSLVPKNTPEYADKGQNYVERLMRALYHFKQCALIGPSGTGKSICAGEPVYVILDGRPLLTTIEDLFERLSRRIPMRIDADGWETVVPGSVDLRVLSMDATDRICWKRPYAIARSIYRGEVVKARTVRNRVLRATPEHSFVSEDGMMKARSVRVGMAIPILRRLPRPDIAGLSEVRIADYVDNAHLTDRGVVVGQERVAVQVPAPFSIRLDEEFSWFLGFFVAEGFVGKGFASIYSKDEAPVNRCMKFLESYRITTSKRRQRGLVEARGFSKAFVSFLSKASVSARTGTGKGSQARYKKVPEFVFSADDSAKLAFLRGFYEGDGWLEEGSTLAMGTSSGELAHGLVVLCEGLGIFPTIRVKAAKVESYSITMGRDGAKRLGVTVGSPDRATDRRGHVEKVRISPHMLAAAKAAYSKLPVEARSKAFHKRTVDHLYASTGMIGLNTLQRIADDLDSVELKRMAETNLLWDPVKEVKREMYDGWVYDFQVPGTETFVAGLGGVVTHNTHIVYLVSELAGLPLWEINCGLQTSVYDMFGRFVGLGKENWVDGQIVSWCRYGGILYLDEANMMKQDVATRLNPLLDTRGHMVLTERDNEVIPRHPQGYVIISMNPYSAEFAGTKPLNAAFRRRMSVWIDFDYLSVGGNIAPDEVAMVSRRSNAPVDVAEKIVRAGAEIRRRYKAGDLPYGPSVGDLVNWATLVSDGLDPAVAAEETIVSLTSDDAEVQSTVRRIVRMILGDGKVAPG